MELVNRHVWSYPTYFVCKHVFIFINFKSAFDQLCFLGCIGKLKKLGIPLSYCNWIESWLNNRRCFIEIEKGGPQGSVLTPTIFITYQCDLDISLPGSLNHLFADDLLSVQQINFVKAVVM